MEQKNDSNRLVELDGSGYEIVDDQPDIDGWSIYNNRHEKIGKVEDLLFDPQSRKVRYIIANLRDNDFSFHARKVLIPIGVAQLHEKDDDVIVPDVTAEQLNALPEYHKDQLTESNEREIFRIFSVGAGASADIAASTGSWYEQKQYSDENLYRNRSQRRTGAEEAGIPVSDENIQTEKNEWQAGGIRLRSRIGEQPLQEEKRLRQEQVQGDRVTVDQMAAAASLQDQEFEVAGESQVNPANTEARFAEENFPKKDITEEDRTINDTPGKTGVDIERNDDLRRGDR